MSAETVGVPSSSVQSILISFSCTQSECQTARLHNPSGSRVRHPCAPCTGARAGAAQMFVLAGFKTVALFPPSQAASLYPAPQRLGTHYCLLPLAALDPSSPQVLRRLPTPPPLSGTAPALHLRF